MTIQKYSTYPIGGYNWKNQMHEEVSDYINSNFESLKKAFDFFSHGRHSIDEDVFK
jgi:hypothetical protein